MAESEAKLKKLLQTIATKHNYTSDIVIKPITSAGANHTTDLFVATLKEPSKPDLNIFAKVANLSEETRLRNHVIAKVYLVEAVFYTELAVNYQRIYDKHNTPVANRLRIPKYYGHDLTKLQEVLVLENLEADGYLNFDRMRTFDWEYADTAVKNLARFHALGVAFREENPAEFNRVVTHFEVDYLSDPQMVEAYMTKAVQNGCEAVSEEYGGRLKKFFSSMDLMMKLMGAVVSDKTMLVHGDYRPSNLMHRREDNKLQIISLDYQTLRLGNPVADLMNFIFCGSDEEFRRNHYDELLENYYKEFSSALKGLGVDAENVYPRATYEQDLIELRPLGLILALSTLAVVTAEGAQLPRAGALASMAASPNALARERIAGVARDYARWGLL